MEWIWLLIGLSAVLHLITILAIVILFQRNSLEKLSEPQQEDETEAIHQSIEAFVTKLEGENETLYQKLVDYIKRKENKLDERIRVLEEKLDNEAHTENLTVGESLPALQQHSKQMDTNELMDKQQKEDKVSQLYKQGFSSKQIAKILQIDNGEVELIINMLRKKQSYHK